MADWGLLAGIGEGLKQGLSSYQQSKSFQEEQRRQAERDALAQKQFQFMQDKEAAETERQYRTSGFKKDETGQWVPDYGFLQAKASLDPNKQILQQLQEQKYKQDIKESKEKELQKRVPGFDVQEGIAPTPQDVEKIKAQSAAVNNISTSINRLKDLVNQSGGAKVLPGEIKTAMQQEYANIKIAAKEAANLGALTGPDVDILEQAITDPTSLKTAATLDKAGILSSLERASNIAQKGLESAASARGFLKKQEPQRGLLSQQRESISQKMPKPGQIENGYKFIGGDPADQKSWEKVK